MTGAKIEKKWSKLTDAFSFVTTIATIRFSITSSSIRDASTIRACELESFFATCVIDKDKNKKERRPLKRTRKRVLKNVASPLRLLVFCPSTSRISKPTRTKDLMVEKWVLTARLFFLYSLYYFLIVLINPEGRRRSGGGKLRQTTRLCCSRRNESDLYVYQRSSRPMRSGAIGGRDLCRPTM